MTRFQSRILVPAVAGLGLAALGAGLAFAAPGASSSASAAAGLVAPGATGPASTADAPFRCGVFATAAGGMTQLEAVVESDTALSGTYTLAVDSTTGGGRSQVNQGGPFTLSAGQTATLGTVTIGQGAQSTIVFEVDVSGTVWTCAPDLA